MSLTQSDEYRLKLKQTFQIGTLTVSPKDLLQLFAHFDYEPRTGTVTKHWVFGLPLDGGTNIYTVYDHKMTSSYAREYPSLRRFWTSTEKADFRIGGHSYDTLGLFGRALVALAEDRGVANLSWGYLPF